MDNRRKTAIYCRTALTDDGKIAAQEARLRAYADEHGCTDIVCHSDNGTAGNTLERPALTALTASIRAGEIGAVLATDVSRIARTRELATEWHKLIHEYNVAFVTLAEGGLSAAAATPGVTYRRVGDYLLPNITLTEREGEYPPLGRYGAMHKEYLRREKPVLYAQLLLSERLYPLCRETDSAARTRLKTISNREVAHETILAELVYA